MPKGSDWWKSQVDFATGVADFDLSRAVGILEELQEASRVPPAQETPAIRVAQENLYWALDALRRGQPDKAKGILRGGTVEALYDL